MGCMEKMKEIIKKQDILTDEEIAIRLTDIWANSEYNYIDKILNVYDIALEHVKDKR